MPTRRALLAAGLAGRALVSAGSTRIDRDEIPTPALLVDLDAFEANVQLMASFVKARGLALRPHAKTHKCPEIALRLMKAGAVGACAAKISEAEALADGGVSGLLITSAMVGRWRIERAVRLAQRRPETVFSVDNAQNAEDLNAAAAVAKVRLHVAVDLLVGRRTGIPPGAPAAGLVQRITALKNLRFAGLQAYAGHASHTVGFESRKRVSEEAMGQAVDTRRMLERSGIECAMLTGGSTGTYNIDAAIDGVTELQPGSFVFMDLDYNRIGGKSGEFYSDFRNSLFVLATVISKPADDTVIVDAGFKAFSTDRPFGPVLRAGQGEYSWAGDEHGRVMRASAKLGDRLEFVVPHCDPTVNLYDRLYAVRGGVVEGVWPISARGKSQ